MWALILGMFGYVVIGVVIAGIMLDRRDGEDFVLGVILAWPVVVAFAILRIPTYGARALQRFIATKKFGPRS